MGTSTDTGEGPWTWRDAAPPVIFFLVALSLLGEASADWARAGLLVVMAGSVVWVAWVLSRLWKRARRDW